MPARVWETLVPTYSDISYVPSRPLPPGSHGRRNRRQQTMGANGLLKNARIPGAPYPFDTPLKV
jgi:hypothetical protein